MATMVQHRLARGQRSLGKQQGAKIATLISRLADRNKEAAALVLARHRDAIPSSERREIEAKLNGALMIEAANLRRGDTVIDSKPHYTVTGIAPHGLFFTNVKVQIQYEGGGYGTIIMSKDRRVVIRRAAD